MNGVTKFFVLMLLDVALLFTGKAERPASLRHTFYSGTPNHREIAVRALELANEAGFLDTEGITQQQIQDRIEAGAYSEDYDLIPGLVGEHYPHPWEQGPEFDFDGLYPISRIPYGGMTDKLSGWYRGSPHGYDPVQGFKWPGTDSTTVAWANAVVNAFSWDHAIELYRSGKKAEAYECIGHLLHLLADLSIPEHVKIINHGMSVTTKNAGTILSPDLVTFVVDEYELSLAGGLELPHVVTFIPDLLGEFRNAVSVAKLSRIPEYGAWPEYFIRLALFTYNDSLVNRYYCAPSVNQHWGVFKNRQGDTIEPTRYGITPPGPIAGRWAQSALKSTASISSGSIIPREDMIAMCDTLVPKAVEYCAGLLLKFLDAANNPATGVRLALYNIPEGYLLNQNYPNPFNPTTRIAFAIPKAGFVSLKMYDVLGREVATLVDETKQPGECSVTWDASGMPSGVYFYRLQAGPFAETKKLILLK